MQSSRDGVRLTRRQFVAAGAMGGAALAAGCAGTKQGNWDFLNDPQARTLAAICDQIIPADDFPSASIVNLPGTTGATEMPTGTGLSRPMR
jgi:hypothetical protein